MLVTNGVDRFSNCAESLPAYRLQRHTLTGNLHVKAAILYFHGKLGVLKGFKGDVLEVS